MWLGAQIAPLGEASESSQARTSKVFDQEIGKLTASSSMGHASNGTFAFGIACCDSKSLTRKNVDRSSPATFGPRINVDSSLRFESYLDSELYKLGIYSNTSKRSSNPDRCCEIVRSHTLHRQL